MAKTLNLSVLTAHIAVTYLDSLLQKSKMNPKLASVVCLVLAAKYEELDRKIPKYEEFIKVSGLLLTKEALKKYEAEALNALCWKLNVITSISFLQILLTQGIIFPTDHIPNISLSSSLAGKVVQRAIGFSNKLLERDEMLEFPSSITAASCIALSRKATNIEPLWPPQLFFTTGYTFNQLKKCFSIMSRDYLGSDIKSINLRASDSRQILRAHNNFANVNRKDTKSLEKRTIVAVNKIPFHRKSSTRQRSRLSSIMNSYNNESNCAPAINKSSEVLPTAMRLRRFQKRVILKGDMNLKSIIYSNPKENLGITTNSILPTMNNVTKKGQGFCLLKYKYFMY